ncbi:unnamed protein product, partial [Ilex paraguariensis]
MYCETANETASESRLVVSAHRADRVGKDTQVPKERAVRENPKLVASGSSAPKSKAEHSQRNGVSGREGAT